MKWELDKLKNILDKIEIPKFGYIEVEEMAKPFRDNLEKIKKEVDQKLYDLRSVHIASFGKRGNVSLMIGKCSLCGKTAEIIAIDNSEGEYQDCNICRSCTIQSFAKIHLLNL